MRAGAEVSGEHSRVDGGTSHPDDILTEGQTGQAGDHDSGFGYVKLEVLVRNLEQRWLIHSHFPLILFFFLIFIYFIYYFFLAVLGLRCCARVPL